MTKEWLDAAHLRLPEEKQRSRSDRKRACLMSIQLTACPVVLQVVSTCLAKCKAYILNKLVMSGHNIQSLVSLSEV